MKLDEGKDEGESEKIRDRFEEGRELRRESRRANYIDSVEDFRVALLAGSS